MPYYLYAMAGDTTPYYDAMTLIRQTAFDQWRDPFDEVKARLQTWQRS
jgi:hypothetical protein